MRLYPHPNPRRPPGGFCKLVISGSLPARIYLKWAPFKNINLNLLKPKDFEWN